MRAVRFVHVLALVLCTPAVFAQAIAALNPSSVVPRATVNWARTHAISLGAFESIGAQADLRFLPGIVGSARLVGFGEAKHGVHETLLLRNLLFRYLVENLGFTAIALETDFAEALAIDDYVTGSDPDGDRGSRLSRELVASVWSIGAPQAWQENLQLIQWMHQYNSRSGIRKIRFYGLEMMGHNLSIPHPLPNRPFEAALDYMMTVDPIRAQAIQGQLRPLLARLSSRPYPKEEGIPNPYDEMGADRQNALTLATDNMVALFERRHVEWIAKTSSLAYHRGYRSALNARALDADFRARGWWVSRRGDRNQRDATSAQNLLWALDREGTAGRIFFVAHNVHVVTAQRKCKDPRSVRSTSMGEHLKQTMHEGLMVVGSVHSAQVGEFSEGTPCIGGDTLYGALPQVGLPAFVLDLRASAPEFSDGFDAAVFLDRTTPARLMK